MILSTEIFEHKLLAPNILESGCLLDLFASVTSSGSKELLTVFVEAGGFDKIMESDRTDEVLDFFIDLATILVNSYDERLGILSAFIYYMCERDRYSIDVQWAWRDVRRFEKFLLWLEPLLPKTRALKLLEFALNNFPPTRVTPPMLEALNKILPAILDAIGNLPTDGELRAENLAVGNDLIASICYFGLGLELREFSRTDLIISNEFFPKLKDARCPNSYCEYLRRARKSIRCRDESPIEQNKDPAAYLMGAIKVSGVLEKALKVDRLAEAFRAQPAELTVDLDSALLDLFAVVNLWETTFGPLESLSKIMEELNDAIISQRYVERYFRIVAHSGKGCLPRGLGLWIVYYVRGASADAGVSKRCMEWLELMCRGIMDINAGASKPYDDGLALPFLALLFSAYNSSLLLRPTVQRPDGQYCADEYFCSWPQEISAAVGEAVGRLIVLTEQYTNSQIQPPLQDWFKRHVFQLCCALGIVCGVHEYGKIPELRRHVIYPAAGACGVLTDKCRLFRELAKKTDCILIKQVGEICLMRAEQASGVRLVLS